MRLIQSELFNTHYIFFYKYTKISKKITLGKVKTNDYSLILLLMSEIPREGSIMYNIMNGKKGLNNEIKRFRFWNKYFIVPLYRFNVLPLFFIGKIFILLETVGRKSGLKRYTPIEFRIKDNDLLVFSSRGKYSDWYRNMNANTDKVRYKKGFRWYDTNISVIKEFDEKLAIMRWYVINYPAAARALFGWDKKKDTLENTDLGNMIRFIEIVKLK